MAKIPTNLQRGKSKTVRPRELPLDLYGKHVLEDGSASERLYNALRHAILSGVVEPGQALPPSRELAKESGFRRNTVTDAYERLIADGFATARVGAGTFVAQQIPTYDAGAAPKRIAMKVPQQGVLALGCTYIDDQALRRFRGFVGRRLRSFSAEHLHYGDPRGSRELRVAIANHLLSARGLRCDPDQIMLTSGTQHSLRIALSAILKIGEQIWIEDPGYPSARRSIEHYGGLPVSVPVDDAGMIVAKGREAAPNARATYVTPSHQFPLGVQMTMPRRIELLDWAREANAWIFEDDYDSEFRYDGAPLLSLAGIDHLRRVIYMGTFAKTLFPGLRIGYCALPEDLIGPVTAARAAMDRYPATVMEGAIADMLDSGAFAANLRKMRTRYRDARDALAQALIQASEGRLTVPVPSQGLHLVAKFESKVALNIAAKALASAGVDGWLLSDTYFRARAAPGFVLGFAGHPSRQIIAAAKRLGTSSLAALHKMG